MGVRDRLCPILWLATLLRVPPISLTREMTYLLALPRFGGSSHFTTYDMSSSGDRLYPALNDMGGTAPLALIVVAPNQSLTFVVRRQPTYLHKKWLPEFEM